MKQKQKQTTQQFSVPKNLSVSRRHLPKALKTVSNCSIEDFSKSNDLEQQLRTLVKQNDKLSTINQYLQQSVNKRDQILEVERMYFKSRQLISPTNNNSNSQSFQVRHQTIKYHQSASKLQMINDDNLKLSHILEMNISDEDITYSFDNDPAIKYLRQLDEDSFIQAAQEQNIKKLLQIHENTVKVVSFLKELFDAILKLKRIIKASLQFNEQVQLNSALQSIIENTRSLMGCDRVSCFIVDEAKGEIWSKVAQGINTIIRMPIDKGVVGFAATRKECVNIINAYSDQRFNKEFDLINNQKDKTKTILASPIINEKNQCLGVIQCVNKFDGIFSNDDLSYLKIISQFSRNALHNTLGQNQIEFAQNKLRQIIKQYIPQYSYQFCLFQLTEIKEIIEETDKLLKKIMNVDDARTVIRQNSNIIFQSNGQFQYLDDFLGIFQECIQCNSVQSIPNCSSCPFYDPQLDLQTSMPIICMPIRDIAAFMVLNVKGLNKKQTQNSRNAYISSIELELLEYVQKSLLIKLQ